MLNHVFLGTNDVDQSRAFYNATMAAIGVAPVGEYPHLTIYANAGGTVAVGKPANGEAANPSNGATLGLKAASYAEVDAWHAAGVDNGGTCDGAPGFRPNSPGNMYGAYLRDPDGNKICAFTPNVGDKA